jgi:hypothetical protein
MTKKFLPSLLALVTNLDENVSLLLQTVALQPFGSEILISSGVCSALKAAARAYLVEEESATARIRDSGSSYIKLKLGTPRFLLGHLKLLSTLMASSSLSEKHSSELAIGVLEIAAVYKSLVQRLCYEFPSEGDILRWFMRCFVQAASLAQPIHPERHDILSNQRSRLQRIFSENRFVENGILMLCQQLWENPLPRDLLPSLPESLKDVGTNVESSVVSFEKDQRQSWWDVLDYVQGLKAQESRFIFNAPMGSNDFGYWSNKSPKKWNENKFEYTIVAADILSLGLSLLKRLNCFEMLDRSSIARGLFKCACAAQVSNLETKGSTLLTTYSKLIPLLLAERRKSIGRGSPTSRECG